jgi:hypothetical protein
MEKVLNEIALDLRKINNNKKKTRPYLEGPTNELTK